MSILSSRHLSRWASSNNLQALPNGSHNRSAWYNFSIFYLIKILGATHESQCYSTNQCATGEDNCSWHAVCIDLPDDNDVPSFQCKCKPGYRGNGTHCTDACNNFCLNDGICKKNHVGFVECVCKENFSGERCEIRFQPRTQKIALITAGIGGVVLILIVIVVIIWMISFRFNRVDDFSCMLIADSF